MIKCKLPDLGKSAAKLKIMIDLEARVAREVSLYGKTINLAFESKESPDMIIQTVKQQISDVPNKMIRILGEKLYDRIVEIEL